jgi:hypothetical protein
VSGLWLPSFNLGCGYCGEIIRDATISHTWLPLRISRFAAGKGTALVVDIGEGVSSVVPIYDGFVLKKGRGIMSC